MFIKIFRNAAHLLTKPSSLLYKESDIRHSRLLSSLLIPLIIFFAVAAVLTPEDETIMLAILSVFCLGLYFLSRTRHYKIAAGITLAVFTIFMFASLYEGSHFSNDRLVSEMKFMCIPLLFGSLCLSFRFMLPYNILTIISLSQIQLFMPINKSYNLLEGVVFVSIVSVLGLIASGIQRNQQDKIDLEREKSDKLLKNILPDSIAEELKQNDKVIPRNYDEATILFADIVGFTSYSTTVDAMELVDLLNDVFSGIDDVVARYKLEKIKTIGDAYMIAGGIPVKSKTHCRDAAQAAGDIIRLVEKLSREKGIDLQIRIGIDSGPVVAGVIGTNKFIYDVWGDTVNLASRLESSGIPGKIHISRSVAEKLHPEFQIFKRGEIEIKGRGKMMTYILH